MNKLLVPFDFSVYATNALEYAISLAACTEAEVTVFHTFQIAVSAPAGEDLGPTLTYKQAMIKEEKDRITSQIEDMLQAYSDKFYIGKNERVQFDVVVRSGNFEECIQRHVAHKPYNLIVMGTEGAFGWEEVFGGSHTSHIVKDVNAHVLVIPIEAYFNNVHHIIYATNFDNLDEAALKELLNFNDYFEAKMTCLHINSKPEDVMDDQTKLQELKDNFKYSKHPMQFELVMDSDVEEAIFNYARKHRADILAVLPQEHGFIGSFFHDSLSKNMSMHTDLPLLIIKE